MTTYNTGNPIGSSAAKDLYDNAENLDVAINSSGRAPAGCKLRAKARASFSHNDNSWATAVHSSKGGGGLASKRESVNKSCTKFCIRAACCAISAK